MGVQQLSSLWTITVGKDFGSVSELPTTVPRPLVADLKRGLSEGRKDRRKRFASLRRDAVLWVAARQEKPHKTRLISHKHLRILLVHRVYLRTTISGLTCCRSSTTRRSRSRVEDKDG